MPENQTIPNNRKLLKKNMEDKKMNMKRLYDLKQCTDKAVIGIHYRLTGAIGVAASAFLNPLDFLAGAPPPAAPRPGGGRRGRAAARRAEEKSMKFQCVPPQT